MSTALEVLRQVLEDARDAGFLGPGPVEAHLDHATAFAEVVEAALDRTPANFVDLGTGGGVPGLVLATRWPEARAVFVDSGRRRCAFLIEALERLGIGERVEVLEERAETVARREECRRAFELATARSFAAPAITAEIAAGLVGVGGILVVSEPPDSTDRWPDKGLDQLGFAAAFPVTQAGAHFVVIRRAKETPDRFPRAVGIPAKRPLW